jgi:perosamine synthetase
MSSLSGRIVEAVRKVVGDDDRTIPLHEPAFEGNEWAYVKDCIDTRWVSSAGRYVDRFEEMLAEYTGARRAVAVVNGTAALHVALLLAGVRRDDEVLIPALTFVATANAVTYCGAIPHLVDSEERTLGMDPEKLGSYLREVGRRRGDGCVNRRTGRRIRAVVPMHTFGHPVDLEPLSNLCDQWGIVMVEDAAESLGSHYRDRHTGTYGRVSALSFNGNKIITTGGGGAILTNDTELADRAKHLTTTGKRSHRWRYDHDVTAFNYRMPNINAALGCAQMECLDRFLNLKREVANRYAEALRAIKGVRFVEEPPFGTSNYWLNAILLDGDAALARDEILEASHAAGFLARPAWTLMSRLPMYADAPRMDLTVAESLEARLINIPSSPNLIGTDAPA